MILFSKNLEFKISTPTYPISTATVGHNTVKKETKSVESSINPLEYLNLANEATATSDALSEEEKRQAAQLSNLGLFINPNYAKKYHISENVVELKKKKCEDYIRLLAPPAIEQYKKNRIPASITIAQGLLETNAGDSKLAKENNNHFGIKCFSKTCRKGHCTNATDDTHKDFFRKYSSIDECMNDRSAFLTKGRYMPLYALSPTDYKGWAKGLKSAGYATAPNYAEALISIIEAFNLSMYDK
jgi:flagellum-specific peptidoglycan hydrolase FlgJ